MENHEICFRYNPNILNQQIAATLFDIIGEEIIVEKQSNTTKDLNGKKCKTFIGEVCRQLYTECSIYEMDGNRWCDIEITEDGQKNCAKKFCDDPISGDISDDILQTAAEMFTYIVTCPTKERV